MQGNPEFTTEYDGLAKILFVKPYFARTKINNNAIFNEYFMLNYFFSVFNEKNNFFYWFTYLFIFKNKIMHIIELMISN